MRRLGLIYSYNFGVDRHYYIYTIFFLLNIIFKTIYYDFCYSVIYFCSNINYDKSLEH